MANRVAIVIDMELTEPVNGSVLCGDAPPRRFSGWLQLHSALEAISSAARSEHENQEGRSGAES